MLRQPGSSNSSSTRHSRCCSLRTGPVTLLQEQGGWRPHRCDGDRAHQLQQPGVHGHRCETGFDLAGTRAANSGTDNPAVPVALHVQAQRPRSSWPQASHLQRPQHGTLPPCQRPLQRACSVTTGARGVWTQKGAAHCTCLSVRVSPLITCRPARIMQWHLPHAAARPVPLRTDVSLVCLALQDGSCCTHVAAAPRTGQLDVSGIEVFRAFMLSPCCEYPLSKASPCPAT